jgi:hypothetical protein
MRPYHPLRIATLCLIALCATAPVGAQPAAQSVGVVDFYSPTPLPPFNFTPERYAADDLSALLSRGAAPYIVIPRATIAQAQAAMRWQEVDVLHFDRLRALAAAVGANRLIVGWIPLLVVHQGGGVFPSGGDAAPRSADVNLVIQVFDAAQGRLTAERRFAASILGPPTRDLVGQEVLDRALRSAAPAIAPLLTEPASLAPSAQP